MTVVKSVMVKVVKSVMVKVVVIIVVMIIVLVMVLCDIGKHDGEGDGGGGNDGDDDDVLATMVMVMMVVAKMVVVIIIVIVRLVVTSTKYLCQILKRSQIIHSKHLAITPLISMCSYWTAAIYTNKLNKTTQSNC